VRTLASNKHSGQYGGAAPDALVVLLCALATLWDESGDVAVAGLRREEWTGESYTDEEFRQLAEIEEDLPIVGTGGIGSKIWSGPGITVLGIVSAGSGSVAARSTMRLTPERLGERALSCASVREDTRTGQPEKPETASPISFAPMRRKSTAMITAL
jgi:hypothetical protein